MRSGIWIPSAIMLSFVLGMAIQSALAGDAKDEPRVTGLGGFFFKAQSPGKLAEWYRVHLGVELQPAGKGDNAPRFTSFEWSERDKADKHGSTSFSIFPADTKYFGPGSSQFMVNFRVANLDRLLAQLKSEGVTVIDKSDDESFGKFGWAVDSEGNRIELWEPKDE
jgi:predicted enzyme related to lactoylglutathione lyase